jgi:hypothetical protein
MRASSFFWRCTATIFVVSVAIWIVSYFVEGGVPPDRFYLYAGAPMLACAVLAIIANIWED